MEITSLLSKLHVNNIRKYLKLQTYDQTLKVPLEMKEAYCIFINVASMCNT